MNALKLIARLGLFPLLLVALGNWELHRIDTDAMGVAHGADRVQQFLAPGVVFFGLLSALIGAGALVWIQRAGKRAQQSQAMLISTFLEGMKVLPGWLVTFRVTVSATVVLILAYECLALFKQGAMPNFDYKTAIVALLAEAYCLYAVWLVLRQSRSVLNLFEPTPWQMFGHRIQPDQAPELWRQMEEWARQLDALPPDHIVVSLSSELYITACEICLYPEELALQGRTLHIPLCLLALLSREEIGAIVAHELAHFIGDKADYSQRVMPLYSGAWRSLVTLEDSLESGTQLEGTLLLPAVLFGAHFLAQMSDAAEPLRRDRQSKADAAAATLAGNTPLATALLRMAVLGPQIRELLVAYLDLNKRNWPAVEDLAWQAVNELQQRHLRVSNHALSDALPHPTNLLPATGKRLQALGVDVQAVQASATRSTSTAEANAALNVWFSDPQTLCRQLSYEQVAEAVKTEPHNGTA